MRTRAILQVTPQFLVTWLIACKEGEEARAFRVIENALPTDTQLVRICYGASEEELLLVLDSAHFTIAPNARVHQSGYPYLEAPVCQVEYSK